MKYLLNSIFVLTISSVLSSCDSQEGDWDDNIHLSTRSVNFTSSSDSTLITTESQWWWIYGISIDGENYNDFDDVYFQSKNYSIMRDSLTIERRDYTNIFVSVGENTTNRERTFIIGLQAGNYFDSIKIIQEE